MKTMKVFSRLTFVVYSIIDSTEKVYDASKVSQGNATLYVCIFCVACA